VALEALAGAETIRRGGVADVVEAVVREDEVLVAGLAGDAVLATPFTAGVAFLAGVAVTVRLAAVVVVVVVVVVFFTVDVVDTAGLAAGLVVAGAALGAAGLGAGEAGAAGVAFLSGDNLVGRAGFGESTDGLASVVAARL
jgi:hypothetical protein